MSIRLVTLVITALGLGGAATAQYTPEPTPAQLSELRQMMIRFETVDAVKAAGYAQSSDCMSSAQGAQGIHYARQALIDDPRVDALTPELVQYEQRADGSLRLIGVEYLVFQKAWHDAGNKAAPALLGQEFVLNTVLQPQPFYALHVWAWQYNPKGLFANWNPLVTCTTPAGQTTTPHHPGH